MLMSHWEVLFAFISGGMLYTLIELIYRGRTHISMGFAGAICFTILHALFVLRQMPLLLGCIVGAIIITAVEFLFGFIVNMRLHLNVWDYSKKPLNLYGQICLGYSIAWGLLTIPAAFLSKSIHGWFA